MLNFIRRQRLKVLKIKLAGVRAEHRDLQHWADQVKTIHSEIIFTSGKLAARIAELEAEVEYIEIMLGGVK